MRIQTGITAGKGLGDVVADLTHTSGTDRLAAWYTQVTGQDCSCQQRRDMLNQLFPQVG